jgi:hypothetical protein
MFWLSGVEDGTDYILAFSFEVDWLAQTTSNHFAEELILNSIIQEDRTTFNV